jgi:hypothetical protein
MTMKSQEILTLSEKLSKFSLLDPNQLDIYQEYMAYKKLRESEKRGENGIDLPEISPVMRYKNSEHQSFLITPFHLNNAVSNGLFKFNLR